VIPLSEDIDIGTIPFSQDEVKQHRMCSRKMDKLKRSLETIPFFTHPLELINRSDNIDINHIRSAVKGGRILPYRACGESRQGDPQWANIFISLSPNPPDIPEGLTALLEKGGSLSRKDISEAVEMIGDTLTELIGSLIRANVISSHSREAILHLGAPEGYIPISGPSRFIQGDRSYQQSRSIREFLTRMGPFTLVELSKIFGWESGWYPPGLSAAVRGGMVKIGMGPRGPMEKRGAGGNEVSLWLWSDGGTGRYPVPQTNGSENMLITVPGTDHGLIFTGQDPKWIESDHVRGSRSVRLIL
jgi:hypothetical protein